MKNINYHIIHCSDSTFGDVTEIKEWHKARGFLDVGYHFVIKKNGVIEVGRPLNKMGAHCKGYNQNSIGTCLIGVDDFTEEQFESLNKIHKMLNHIYPHIALEPHYKFNKNKSCPNFNPKEKVML